MQKQKLDSIRGLILDMDGVIWRGSQVIQGAGTFLNSIRDHQMPHLFVTNNATSTPTQISQKAKELGLEIPPDRILTSSLAAVAEVKRKFPSGAKLFVIGESGLRELLQLGGFELLERADHAQAVVVGLDRKVTWEAMSEAAYAIEAGALFIGTNADASLPTERGYAPGNGAILAALEQTTGIRPLVVGKPEPHLFLESAHTLELEPDQILVIGDRLETDILGGKNAGMPTALILTGASKTGDLDPNPVQPDLVFHNLAELSSMLWSDEQ